MKWFTGSINEAVVASKSRKAVFVVFVAGDDEASTETTKAIDTPEVSSCLESSDFVAIRLESGSESYRFFAQIYQLVPVPSLFFIGDNGQPLEIVAGSVTMQTLQEKIGIVLTKAGKAAKNEASNDFIKGEQTAAVSQAVAETSTVQEPTSETPETSTESIDKKPEEATEQILTAEEKVERAKKLIELQKQQKMEKEREQEKQRELERRQIGKDVLSAKQRQQDLEIKLVQEERRKEKAAETEARERVRQQIAQDKLERKQREQTLLQQQATQQPQERSSQQAVTPPADGVVRIQFKLPSGSPHMGKFQTTTTLRELRTYVTGNIDLPFRHFSMSTSFPRRDLSTKEDRKTLIELHLVPTAVILILPLKNTTTSDAVTPREETGFFSRFMWAVFSPIVSVYNYVVGYFTGPPARGASREETDEPATGRAQRPATRRPGPPSGLLGRNLGGPTTTIRARGNVHRLHTGGDDNDENNTWNGNSTQQM